MESRKNGSGGDTGRWVYRLAVGLALLLPFETVRPLVRLPGFVFTSLELGAVAAVGAWLLHRLGTVRRFGRNPARVLGQVSGSRHRVPGSVFGLCSSASASRGPDTEHRGPSPGPDIRTESSPRPFVTPSLRCSVTSPPRPYPSERSS